MSTHDLQGAYNDWFINEDGSAENRMLKDWEAPDNPVERK